MVDGAVEPFALMQVRSVENPGDCETIISPEGVDDHGATSVSALRGGQDRQISLRTVH